MGWQCGEVVMQTDKGEQIVVGYDGTVYTMGDRYILVQIPGGNEPMLFEDGKFLTKQ